MTHPSSPPLHIIRLPSTSLETYPRLDELVALINNAFVTSWRTIEGLTGDDATRYETVTQFVEDMGEQGVTWVACEGDEGGRMVATAGCKPWNAVWKTLERLKVKGEVDGTGRAKEEVQHAQREEKANAEEGMESFELVAVAVDPSLQKSGLAARLCSEVEMELKENARKIGKKRLKMIIRTGKENNEVYWTKKGYRFVSEMKFPVGDFGSKTGFTILDMERIVEV